MSKKNLYQRLLWRQGLWIASHGTTLQGYIERYGDPGILTSDGKPMYGDGGTAIFNADMKELQRIQRSFSVLAHCSL